MNTVQPIRDINKLHAMEKYLKKKSMRDYMLIRLGCYSGLRISDIIKLKVKDVRNKTHFKLKENKTDKSKKLLIPPEIKEEIDEYIKNMNDDDYLFPSQKYNDYVLVKNPNKNGSRYIKVANTSSNSPISRVQAYRIINEAARKVGIKDEIGTHSLRKTFGYHFYMRYKNNPKYDPVSILQMIFNHSKRDTTLRYIGITQDDIDDMMRGFVL